MAFVGVALAVSFLGAAGVLPRWAGLVHAVAPPPLDLSFDLRVLVARAPSYPAFALGVVGSVAIRSLLLATLLPALGARMSMGRRWRWAARFYGAALIPMAAGAALEFAGLASVYAWYSWAGLGLIVLTALVMMPRVLGPGITPLAFGGMVGIGALAQAVPEGRVPLIVPLSAALTLLALSRSRRSRTGPSRFAAVALSAAVASSSIGVMAAPKPPRPRRPVLFLVPGVDTSTGRGALYRFQPSAIGFDCERVFYYSYRGPGGDQPPGEAPCPIRVHEAYRTEETQLPLADLVEAFIGQVGAIRSEARGAPVVVVTHSQGAVIAWAALASGRAEGVTHLIALGGFPHSPVGYPPPGEDGEGRVGADVLRLLSAISRGVGSGSFSPDAPLAREILARPDGLEDVFGRPLPEGVAAATVFTSFDTIAAPEGSRIPGVPAWTIDGTHVGIVESAEAYRAIGAFLRGDGPPEPSLLARISDAVVHAFMPPTSGS